MIHKVVQKTTGSNLLTSFVILKATITCIQKKNELQKEKYAR